MDSNGLPPTSPLSTISSRNKQYIQEMNQPTAHCSTEPLMTTTTACPQIPRLDTDSTSVVSDGGLCSNNNNNNNNTRQQHRQIIPLQLFTPFEKARAEIIEILTPPPPPSTPCSSSYDSSIVHIKLDQSSAAGTCKEEPMYENQYYHQSSQQQLQQQKNQQQQHETRTKLDEQFTPNKNTTSDIHTLPTHPQPQPQPQHISYSSLPITLPSPSEYNNSISPKKSILKKTQKSNIQSIISMKASPLCQQPISKAYQNRSSSSISSTSSKQPQQKKNTSANTTCRTCGKTYTESSNLSKHIRTVHLKLRPFHCNQCPAKFAERNKLGKHIQSVHERARPFQCDQCGATFSQASDRKRHRLVLHEGRRPFVCSLCCRAFGRRSSLTQHCTRVHKIITNTNNVNSNNNNNNNNNNNSNQQNRQQHQVYEKHGGYADQNSNGSQYEVNNNCISHENQQLQQHMNPIVVKSSDAFIDTSFLQPLGVPPLVSPIPATSSHLHDQHGHGPLVHENPMYPNNSSVNSAFNLSQNGGYNRSV